MLKRFKIKTLHFFFSDSKEEIVAGEFLTYQRRKSLLIRKQYSPTVSCSKEKGDINFKR